MELIGDKEKILRAYLRAKKMDLSPALQERLNEALSEGEKEGKAQSQELPVEKINLHVQTKFEEWSELLKNKNKKDHASKFFLEHAQQIIRDFSNIDTDGEFLVLLKKIQDPKLLLSITPFGRLLTRSPDDEARFAQLTQLLEKKNQVGIKEDFFTLYLFFSDPFSWFDEGTKVSKRLSQWVLDNHTALSSVFKMPSIEFLLEMMREKKTSDFELTFLCELSSYRRLTREEIDRISVLAENCHMPNLSKNALLIQSVRDEKDLAGMTLVNRVHYLSRKFVQDDKIITKCTYDFSLMQKKFLSSYLRVGPWIHYFSQRHAEDFRVFKKREWILDSSVRKVHSFYRKMSLRFPPTLVRTNLFSKELRSEIPLFFKETPPDNFGKTMGSFSQILALNYIDSVLEKVRDWAPGAKLTSFASQEFRKWLERSDSETRLNWQQLQSSSMSFSNEQARKLLNDFVVRFSVLVSRELTGNLWMEAPTDILRDLESWILRDLS